MRGYANVTLATLCYISGKKHPSPLGILSGSANGQGGIEQGEKTIAVMLALAVILSLTACGGTDRPSDNTINSSSTTQAEEPASGDKPTNSTMSVAPTDSAKESAEDNQEQPPQETPESDFEYHTYPDGAVEIKKYLGNVEELVLPAKLGGNPVTYIGDGVFTDSTTLKSLIFPDSVTIIGDEAFKGCTDLSSVKLSAATKSIKYKSFADCTSLAEIILPKTIRVISSTAFNGCVNLNAAYFDGEAPIQLESGAFDDTAPNFTIYYREGEDGWESPTHEGYPSVTWDGESPFDNNEESNQPDGNEFGIDPSIWENAMAAYIEAVKSEEAEYGNITSCLYDICGDAIPELFVIGSDYPDSILHVYTYDGEATQILEHGITGNTGDFKQGSKIPTMYSVMATDEGDIYVMLAGRGSNPDWYFEVYYFNEYNSAEGRYIHHDVSAEKSIKYVKNFDIFDGYDTFYWRDQDEFNQARDELRSTVKAYMFSPDLVGMELQEKMRSNPEMFPSNYWDGEKMIEYLESVGKGGALSFGNQ